MTPILGSQAWPELRTAPPNPNTAGYEEPRTSDHPNALRTRPSVTWNRFPLSEGQVVSPLLLPPPFSCHGNSGGGGRLDRSAPGQATQYALLSPSFLPRCPSAGRGVGPALPCHQPAEGSHPRVTTSSPQSSGRRFSCTGLRTRIFMNVV